jgi:hypothetical protein
VESQILVEAESIRTTNSNSLFGKIYLAVGDNSYFPELGWTDFVGSILDNILTVVPRIGLREHAVVPFLDGPFTLEFVGLEFDLLQINCKRRMAVGESELLSTTVSRNFLLENLLSAAASVLRVCEAHGWQSLPVVCSLQSRVAAVERGGT